MAAERQGTVDSRACILPHTRIGDAYRELAAEELCGYHADGFLDKDEFEARRDIILSAKTAAEVESMFADLHGSLLPRPATRPAPTVTPAASRGKRQRMHPAGIWFWGMTLLMGVLLGAICAEVTWLAWLAGALLFIGTGFGGLMAIDETKEKPHNRVDRRA